MELFLDVLSLILAGFGSLEDAGTDSTALRAMIRAHDGSHQVTTECRTGPCNVAGLFVDIQACAVSGQAGLQTCGKARAKVTAVVGRTDHNGRRSILGDQVIQSLYIGICCVVLVLSSLNTDDCVSAIDAGLLCSICNVVADHDTNKLAALLVSHHAAGIQKLKAYPLGAAVFICFNKYPQIFCLSFHYSIPSYPQTIFLSTRIPASFLADSSPVSSLIFMPPSFTGGVKDFLTWVGEPFRP